jgi:TM2 domain-containing membrane protein YozV
LPASPGTAPGVAAAPKSRAITILLGLFLPGVHRMYLGIDPGLGIVQLLLAFFGYFLIIGIFVNVWTLIEALSFKTDGTGRPLS